MQSSRCRASIGLIRLRASTRSGAPVAAWRLLFATLIGSLTITSHAQQAYPNKVIRMIVPYAAGGSVDNLARTISQKMSEGLGQPIIVDTRPGGNATIGSDALVKSPPDGYTLLITAVDHTVIPQLMTVPYDPIRDFAPVGGVSFSQILLVAHPSVPANTLQEIVALAKAKPGALNYSSSGNGGVPHLTGEMFNAAVGTKIQHIPYKGGGPAIVDLVGGQVQLSFAIPINVIAHVKAGRLKAIAITGANRLEPLPEVPTFAEAGVPGFDVKTWFAVFAPPGTPKPIIDRLSAELRRVIALPEVKDRWATQGMEPFSLTPDELGAVVKGDYAKYGKIIRDGNIKIDN